MTTSYNQYFPSQEKTHTSRKIVLPALAAVSLAFGAGSAHAATITDPALASGPGDVIDPTGSEGVNQSFGTAQTTLEARSDLRVLQDFTGFAGGGNNVVSNTVGTLPDIQFQWSGAYDLALAGAAASATLFATSGSSYMNQRNADPGSNSSTLTISFGSWNGSAFTNDQSVSAAAFTLTHLYGTKSGQVTFRDASGTALAGANFSYAGAQNADGAGNHLDIYFGWDSTAESTAAIGSIQITFVDADAEFGSGFDDLAFTTIPEPSSALLTVTLGGLMLCRRKRYA